MGQFEVGGVCGMTDRKAKALAPVKMTDELRADLKTRPKNATPGEYTRLTQEAFMRARERQYGDPLALVDHDGPA